MTWHFIDSTDVKNWISVSSFAYTNTFEIQKIFRPAPLSNTAVARLSKYWGHFSHIFGVERAPPQCLNRWCCIPVSLATPLSSRGLSSCVFPCCRHSYQRLYNKIPQQWVLEVNLTICRSNCSWLVRLNELSALNLVLPAPLPHCSFSFLCLAAPPFVAGAATIHSLMYIGRYLPILKEFAARPMDAWLRNDIMTGDTRVCPWARLACLFSTFDSFAPVIFHVYWLLFSLSRCLGDSGVGKTCLLLRYANDSFSPTFITTIGASTDLLLLCMLKSLSLS